MKTYYFPLAKYASPAKFRSDMEILEINRYIYTIVDGCNRLKNGLGKHDRISRQVEGMEGWEHKFNGFAAKQLRRELVENELTIDRNDVVIIVYDHTETFNERREAYGLRYAEAFLSNRERDAILNETRRPILNKQSPSKRIEKPGVIESELFEWTA